MLTTTTARYTALFASESRELLRGASRALASLATDAPRGLAGRRSDEQAIDAVFRAVHSLKGMAATLAFDAVEALAHALESVLHRARDGALTVTGDVVERLVHAVDALERAVDAALVGSSADVRDDVARLDALATEREPFVPRRDAPGGRVEHAGVARSDSFRSDVLASAVVPRETHVRVARERLDVLLNVSSELTVLGSRLANAVQGAADPRLAAVTNDVVRLIATLHDEVREARTAPVGEVFDRLPRVVRESARDAGKRVELSIEGSDVTLDRGMLEELTDPLVHLLRNAVDHGVEPASVRVAAGKDATGRVTIRAARERNAVTVEVRDDGGGIDRARVAARAGLDAAPLDDSALLELIARPGFTTASVVGRLSGRGVGIDAVRDRVRRLGGSFTLATERGRGSCFMIRLPLTLAVTRALVVRVGGASYAIPITHVVETLSCADAVMNESLTLLQHREAVIPVVRLVRALRQAAPDEAPADDDAVPDEAVVVDGPSGRAAMLVDAIDGQEAFLVKPLPPLRGAFRIFGGVTTLVDGTPALVLDVPALLSHGPA